MAGLARRKLKAATPKERADKTDKGLLLDLSVAHNHVSQVIYDLELGEPVANASRLLTSKKVVDKFREYSMMADHEALRLWVQDTAVGDYVTAQGFQRYTRWLRQGFAVSRLALNVSTALIQRQALRSLWSLWARNHG